MTRHTRLSIAMTTYNGEAYVGEQLESIAAQTRAPDELVVCDDASSDGTVAIVEEFAGRVPFPVRIERNPTNLTTTPNFEKAIGLCTGDVIFLADQDDVWLPEKLEAVAAHFEAHPQVGALFCNGRVCDAALDDLGYDLWVAQWFTPREQTTLRRGRATEVFAKHVVASGNTLAFRASFLPIVLPFPDLRDCADAWIAYIVASVSDFDALDRDLILYRIHGENQFGMHKHTLVEQLAQARWQIESGVFDHGFQLFSAIVDRLQRAPEVGFRASPEALQRALEKRDHYASRVEMSARIWKRLPVIAREAFAGRYGRYSYGLKSVAQDLFLR